MNKVLKKILASCRYIIFLVIIAEFSTRVLLSIFVKEPLLLLYPLKLQTDHLLAMSYEPRGEGGVYTKEIDGRHAIILREYSIKGFRGINFRKININSDGYRGSLNQYKENSKTIFCVGGSSTYGEVTDSETYPSQLQEYLTHYAPGRYLVYNLGSEGGMSLSFLGRIHSLDFKVRPDYVILYAGHNDTDEHWATFKASEQLSAELNGLRYGLLCKYSLLFREVYLGFAIMKPEMFFGKNIILENLEKKTFYDINEIINSAQRFRHNISEVINYVNSIGGRLIYVEEYMNYKVDSLTYKSEFKKTGASDMSKNEFALYKLIHLSYFLRQSMVKDMINNLDARRALYLEPEVFRKYPSKSVLMDHAHLNKKGNRLLAEFIGRKILKLDNFEK